MKKIKILTLLIIIVIAAGCKKETYQKFPAPDWKADDTGQYFASMSAVVQLPKNILPKAGTGDMLGAFVGDECRSVGKSVVTDSASVFFLLITGTPDEQSNITFKYYCRKNGYIYVAEAAANFVADGNFGSIDEPEVINLKALR